MARAICRRGWRGAIGMIVAYALVLQAALAYGIAAQAATHGNVSGTFFVICTNDDGLMADGATAPVKPSTHCPICTLSGPVAAIVPEAIELPALLAVPVARTPFVSVAACLSFHDARAGLTRAP